MPRTIRSVHYHTQLPQAIKSHQELPLCSLRLDQYLHIYRSTQAHYLHYCFIHFLHRSPAIRHSWGFCCRQRNVMLQTYFISTLTSSADVGTSVNDGYERLPGDCDPAHRPYVHFLFPLILWNILDLVGLPTGRSSPSWVRLTLLPPPAGFVSIPAVLPILLPPPAGCTSS